MFSSVVVTDLVLQSTTVNLEIFIVKYFRS